MAQFDALPGRSFTGRVSHVDPAADPQSMEFLIRATFKNSGDLLRPGMFGTLTITTHVTRDAVVVPREAVSYGKNDPFVTAIDNRMIAHRTPVRLGDSAVAGVQVLQGVTPGDQVVVLSYQPVRDGQKVRVDQGGQALNAAVQPTVTGGGGGGTVLSAPTGGGAPAPTYGGAASLGSAPSSGSPVPGASTPTGGAAAPAPAAGFIPSVSPQTYNGGPSGAMTAGSAGSAGSTGSAAGAGSTGGVGSGTRAGAASPFSGGSSACGGPGSTAGQGAAAGTAGFGSGATTPPGTAAGSGR